MARRKPIPTAPLWALLADDIPGMADHCIWQHRDSGATIVLPDGLDPNSHALPNGLTVVNTPSADPDDPDAQETATDRIAELLIRGKERDEARVRVAEITPDGQRAHCADYSPDEFEAGGTINLIRRKWGPGRYSIELYARNPKTRGFSRYAQDVVVIKPEREPDAGDLVSSALTGLREDIKAALMRPTAAEGSEVSRLRETLGLMVMMREAMGLDKLAGARNPNPLELVTQLVGALRGAKDLAKEINQPAEPEGLLEKLAPKAIDMIQASMARQPLAPVQLPFAAPPSNGAHSSALPSSASTGAAAAVGAAPPPNGEAMDAQLAQGLRVAVQTLNGMAMFQMDPDDAADMIFNSDQIPDEVLPILKAPDWFDQLARIAPACQPYKDWYLKTHAALLKIFEEEAQQPAKPADGAAAG
jgi:hypothetical protein